MQAFENRFRFHISQGLQLERALDIGAYRGDFSKLINRLWPGIKVWQFEADERQKPRNPDAYYILLGDQPGERDFYTVDEKDAYTTGSSIYRETTEFYRDPIILKKKMTTLDRIMRRVDFSGNWKEHGLVKLDTQGSEVDILKGARNFGSSAEFVGKTVFHRRLRRPRCSPSLKASLASSAAAPALTLGCAPRCRLVWAMGNGASGGGSGHRV